MYYITKYERSFLLFWVGAGLVGAFEFRRAHNIAGTVLVGNNIREVQLALAKKKFAYKFEFLRSRYGT